MAGGGGGQRLIDQTPRRGLLHPLRQTLELGDGREARHAAEYGNAGVAYFHRAGADLRDLLETCLGGIAEGGEDPSPEAGDGLPPRMGGPTI